jgi:hypothetical protein
MLISRLVGISTAFLFFCIFNPQAVHARDCLVGFPFPFPAGCSTGHDINPVQTIALCAMKQPLDARHSTITRFHCDETTAARMAEDNAKSDATRFANGSLGNNRCSASSSTCTALCASAGSTPLHGPTAANVAFDHFRQTRAGWPGDGDLQIVSQTAGICSSTVVQVREDVSSTGSKSCGLQPPPHYPGPWHGNYAPHGKRVTASAFCGCICQ